MTEAICSANQWTGSYMITASVMKELKKPLPQFFEITCACDSTKEGKIAFTFTNVRAALKTKICLTG